MIDDIEDAITLSMKEASMATEVESMNRRLNWAREIIQNRSNERRVNRPSEQASKEQLEHAMKQAMMNWNE